MMKTAELSEFKQKVLNFELDFGVKKWYNISYGKQNKYCRRN